MFVFFAFICLKVFRGPHNIPRDVIQIKDLDFDDAMHLASDELTIQPSTAALRINSAGELSHVLLCALDNSSYFRSLRRTVGCSPVLVRCLSAPVLVCGTGAQEIGGNDTPSFRSVECLR